MICLACKSISYKFKGASHNFRVETSLVKNWNFHHVNKDGSAEWKEVELTWDQFNQESWGDDAQHFSLDKGMNKVQRFAANTESIFYFAVKTHCSDGSTSEESEQCAVVIQNDATPCRMPENLTAKRFNFY